MDINTKDLIIGIVTIVIAIALYVGIYFIREDPEDKTPDLPNTTTENIKADVPVMVDINLKSKCAEDGENFAQNFRRNLGAGSIWFDPQFHFNSRLNTCLVYIAYNYTILSQVQTRYQGMVVGIFGVVFDVYSNKPILQAVSDRKLSEKGEIVSEIPTNYPPYQNVPNLDVNTFLEQLEVLMNE